MSKAWEARRHFNKKYVEVNRHVELWGIDNDQTIKIPFYEEALNSTKHHSATRYSRIWAEFNKTMPQIIDLSLKYIFIYESEHALSHGAEIILAAAERDDIEFFIGLGKVLEKYKAKKTLTSDMIFGPQSFPDLLAHIWIEGLLWMMTDNAGLQFINGVYDENFKLHSYRKARFRMDLFKHPDPPIIGIRWSSTSGNRGVETSTLNSGKSCMPILKSGWVISEGCLTQKLE
jgi:hypothetical protein